MKWHSVLLTLLSALHLWTCLPIYFFYPVPLLDFFSSIQNVILSYACQDMKCSYSLTSGPCDSTVAGYASDKQPPRFAVLSNKLHVKIPFVGLWHFSCDLFYCPKSSSHGCPLCPIPLPSALTIPTFVLAMRSSILPEGWPPLSLQGLAQKRRPYPRTG